MVDNCKIVAAGARLSGPNKKGWSVEINKVSWYDKEAKWDIRSWNSDHSACGKGISLSEDELNSLREFLLLGGDV